MNASSSGSVSPVCSIPFVIWCAVYSFYYYAQGTISLNAALLNIAKIPINYGTEVGHLWFVYMLMAIYLIAPVFSPWIVSASRRSMELFILLWGVTLLLPFIHLYFPDVWGECYWNATPTLYYFSGFMGYAVLAAYIRRFLMAPSSGLDWAGVGMIVAGYIATAGGFLYRLGREHEVKSLELTWNFTTLNVAFMSAGIFLLFRNIHGNSGNSFAWRLIADLSRLSYGMYLAHIIVLNAVHGARGAAYRERVCAYPDDRVDNLRAYLSRRQADIAVAQEQVRCRLSGAMEDGSREQVRFCEQRVLSVGKCELVDEGSCLQGHHISFRCDKHT